MIETPSYRNRSTPVVRRLYNTRKTNVYFYALQSCEHTFLEFKTMFHFAHHEWLEKRLRLRDSWSDRLFTLKNKPLSKNMLKNIAESSENRRRLTIKRTDTHTAFPSLPQKVTHKCKGYYSLAKLCALWCRLRQNQLSSFPALFWVRSNVKQAPQKHGISRASFFFLNRWREFFWHSFYTIKRFVTRQEHAITIRLLPQYTMQ